MTIRNIKDTITDDVNDDNNNDDNNDNDDVGGDIGGDSKDINDDGQRTVTFLNMCNF